MALPLAVDLDGTLIKCDLFIRAIARFCAARPWNVLRLAAWLARGRPFAKARLTALYPVDASALPYDERLLAWLREEHASGRTLVLATAFDRAAADAVAAHLGLFHQVFASDGRTNLKARRKAERLERAFPDGFVYAGNESADWQVWRAAKRAVIVNAAPRLERRAARAFDVERVFPRA
jgi:phosphoserine phosphatase